MKFFFLIAIAILPGFVKGQVNFSGTVNLASSRTELVMVDEDFGIALKLTKKDKNIIVAAGESQYTIRQEKGYLKVASSWNDELLRTSKSSKEYYLASGDTLYYRACSGWYICLADKSGKIIARCNYKISGNDSEIKISMDKYDIPLAALMAYRMTKRSQELYESDNWLLILSSIL